MSKIMPLDLLSSIKGASSSEAVDELFRVIKNAVQDEREMQAEEAGMSRFATLEDLREDVIDGCDESQKELIKLNFPREKNGFLVVPKVMED